MYKVIIIKFSNPLQNINMHTYTYTHRPNTSINHELISSHSAESLEAIDEGKRKQFYDLIKQTVKRRCS